MYNTLKFLKLKFLIKARLHLGHNSKILQKNNRTQVLGFRHSVSIFNLFSIWKSFRYFFYALKELSFQRNFCFIFNDNPRFEYEDKLTSSLNIKNHLNENIYFLNKLNGRWNNGLLTNKKNVYDLLKKINSSKSSLKVKHLRIQKNLESLWLNTDLNFFDVVNPDFIIAFRINKKIEKEAKLMNIPIVSMVDSNIDNSNHLYSLFGNDDSLESLDFFLKTIELGFKEGQIKEKKIFYYYFLKKLKNNKKLLLQYKKIKKWKS